MKTRVRLATSGWLWLWIALLVIVIDRYSKIWVLTHLTLHEPFFIFPILDFTLAHNTGAAFSFLHAMSGWQNWFFSGLAVIVSLFMLIWLARLPAKEIGANIPLCLILGGALSNAWDRVNYGFVIDFLSFHYDGMYFAIFNIADSAICLGAFLLMWYWFKKPE